MQWNPNITENTSQERQKVETCPANFFPFTVATKPADTKLHNKLKKNFFQELILFYVLLLCENLRAHCEIYYCTNSLPCRATVQVNASLLKIN